MRYVDTLIVNLSDLHTGSSTALFPPRTFGDENQNHTPKENQLRIYDVWKQSYLWARSARKKKRLIVVHNGDAIDGNHHGTIQLCLTNKKTQAAAHVELMDEFLQSAKWNKDRGDLLYYTKGTEIHTGDDENNIARDLGAEPVNEELFVRDHLELIVNGRKIWYLHHGKKRGEGANEGNALRNALRDLFFECLKVGIDPPDVVVTSHTHAHTYTPYSGRLPDGNFKLIHGLILPSWQEKTRFAWQVVPQARNEIGSAFFEITAAGDVRMPPHFIIKETAKTEAVLV